MAGHEGFLYEENAYKALEKFGISTGGTAGASHDKPDLTVKSGKKTDGVELKLSPTAAGSLVMKYIDGKWLYGDVKNDIEKIFLKEIGEKFNLLRNMNTSGQFGANWRGKVPALQNDKAGKKVLFGAKNAADAYAKDLARFGAQNEVKIPVPAKAISDYYNSKKTHYLNVGTHGFYTLNTDPLGLSLALTKMKHHPIPDFGASTSAIIRVRCQYKGGGDYQFVMTLQFSAVKKSPYNIAPLKVGTKSVIDEAALKSDPLLLSFKP